MHNWCGSHKQLERERKLRESHSFVIPDQVGGTGAPGQTRTGAPLLGSGHLWLAKGALRNSNIQFETERRETKQDA